jgi:DNA-binding transcriptional ArsR family regulator
MSEVLVVENATKIKEAALVLRAINHKLRQDIYDYLRKNGPQCVTKIYTEFKLEQSVASQHLAILRNEGFVITEKIERFIYYKANEERMEQVSELSEQLIWEGR